MHKELNRIDSIISKLLKYIDNPKKIKTLTVNQALQTVDKMLARRIQIEDSRPIQEKTGNIIINFIQNRDFAEEIKNIRATKNKEITVKAVEG